MTPLFPNKDNTEFNELCLDILQRGSSLGINLNIYLKKSISDFLLLINSYYTNAMEGNPSKLKDIESAQQKEFLSDNNKRNYQLEHLAHIETQAELFSLMNNDALGSIASIDTLKLIHKMFYKKVPAELHFASTVSGKKIALNSGALRKIGGAVGDHIFPGSEEEIIRHLNLFEKMYDPSRLTEIEQILALAASHHRLLWVHPFNDGNGRVARLFTIFYSVKIGINPELLWSPVRGFARNRADYDLHLRLADERRKGDLDGRGVLSEMNLTLFCKYFLTESLDQINYISSILEVTTFEKRYNRYIDSLVFEKTLSKNGAQVLKLLFFKGKFSRGEIPYLVKVKQRQATNIIKDLLQKRLVKSRSVYGDIFLNITTDMAKFIFPGIV